MRLALVTPAAKREVRREQLRRGRDTALALRQAFPGVEHVRLDFRFQSNGSTTPAVQSRTLHQAARAFFEFPCPFADCDGQFNLGSAVRIAVAGPAHRTTGELECCGKRRVRLGAPDPCQLRLTYTVTAVFESADKHASAAGEAVRPDSLTTLGGNS